MRTEKVMLDLILGYARECDAVRAVVMNGSRLNPNAPVDPFQDFDIVYLVSDVTPFRRRQDIPVFFGEVMIVQTPGDMGPEGQPEPGYTYLMQFMDGNRIDLTFYPLAQAQDCVTDSLSRVLLDKDQIFAPLPPPDDRSYLPTPPTAKAFSDCCNEFWWLNPYVAKGLWRDELPYARYHLDELMRGELLKMLTWDYGLQTNFQKSPGKQGKYLKRLLAPERWALFERTFAGPQIEDTWQALFAMDDLFRATALVVAEKMGFAYPQEDDRRVSAYIRMVHQMAPTAKTIPSLASIILQTEHLTLRRLTPDDLEDLYALYSDPEVRRYFPEGTLSRAQTLEELNYLIQGYPGHPELGLWAVVHSESGRFIGRCGLIPWVIDGQAEVEIAYSLAKDWWGQGLGTEAARGIRDYAFETLGLTRLICVIDHDNRASIRVAEKTGMHFEKEGYDDLGPYVLYAMSI